jgi:putative ABC transport system permease protein
MEIRPIFSAMLRSKTGPFLVALQIAISLAILANAMYVVSLRLASTARPTGVAEENAVVHVLTRSLQPQEHNSILAQRQQELAALTALPGVVSVAALNQMPASRSGMSGSISRDRRQSQELGNAAIYYSPDSLVRTLGLHLLAGRDFTASDVIELDPEVNSDVIRASRQVIVTKAVAALLYPDDVDVLGKPMYFGIGSDASEARIIGVVERLQTPSAEPGLLGEYSVIIPVRISSPMARYAIRAATGQRDKVLGQAQKVLRSVAQVPVIVNGRSMEEDRESRYRNENALAWMLIAVCILLLLVTASGIVGMTALRVTQRRKQIGVRRALGARWQDIIRYFVTENLLITTAGVILGVALAFGLNLVLISHLEMSRLPIAYLLYGVVALLLLGLVAVVGPASRAASIPPALATRSV